jgi:hypothetical protein
VADVVSVEPVVPVAVVVSVVPVVVVVVDVPADCSGKSKVCVAGLVSVTSTANLLAGCVGATTVPGGKSLKA